MKIRYKIEFNNGGLKKTYTIDFKYKTPVKKKKLKPVKPDQL